MPLIYPPQYTAVVVAEDRNDRYVDVSYYNNSLTNEEQTLQLNLDGTVDVRTVNNQYFQASPADHNLVVIYSSSTRSIPAQTTPLQWWYCVTETVVRQTKEDSCSPLTY